MCVITDIAEVIEEYVAKKNNFDCDDVIEKFAKNLISALKKKFKKNINSVKISDSTTVITKIHDKTYECKIYQTCFNYDGFPEYEWSVVIIDDKKNKYH